MDRIHLDYFDYDSKPYLILVDNFSKWMEVQVMHKTDALSTIKTLKHWFTTLRLPHQLVSDNGTQFTSTEFSDFMKLNGINHLRTPAYHQSSNGQVER